MSRAARHAQPLAAKQPAKPIACYRQSSDAELIAACLTDEVEAWVELVDRYEGLVYGIPLHYGLSRAEADDVFQTVWITLLEKLDTLREPEYVSSWLVTTTKHATWDMRRGPEHERMIAMDPAELPEVLDGSSPEEEVARLQQVRRTRRAAAQLDERCRRLLFHLYEDGDKPSYEDIAGKLGLPVGSIGPTRLRCLQKLRAILEDER